MKTGRGVFLVICLLFLHACSNTFIYNQLDWLIPWYVDDYVDLTRVQKKDLKAELKSTLRWHRAEELASYVLVLDRIEQDLQQPLSAATVQSWADLGVAAWERVEARMLPLAFELGADLSDEQMQGFIDKLWQQQQEFEEEYLERNDAEYVEDSYELLEENIREFLGRLSREQKQLLQLAAESLRRFDYAWLEERRAWLEELMGYLKREPGWQQAIREAMKVRAQTRDTRYSEAYLYNQGIINGAIAGALNLRSDKQSARLQRALDRFREDFSFLIAQAD
jgi:hypothetical protein